MEDELYFGPRPDDEAAWSRLENQEPITKPEDHEEDCVCDGCDAYTQNLWDCDDPTIDDDEYMPSMTQEDQYVDGFLRSLKSQAMFNG